MEFTIPEYVCAVLDKLEEKGFSAYIVGGCTRDYFLGKVPHDFDVCTDCLPEKAKEIFCDFPTIETGLKHGTLTVISGGFPVEVTTFRSDGKYIGHRKPECVKFERSLGEDLKRRDFTVNALCLDREGNLTDLFGGREDIERKIIRCVGVPEERFEEDALRIMRGLRFASVLGFEIESETAKAMRKKAELLKEISAERIYTELSKLLCGENVREILLEFKDIFGVIIPELVPTFGCVQNCPHHIYDVYGHICKSVENISPDPELRLCMLLHDIEKPKMKKTDSDGTDHFKKHQFESAYTAERIMKRLKCSKKTHKRVFDLIWEHDNRIPPVRRSVRRLISKYDYDFFADWIAVRKADTLAQSEYRRDEKLRVLSELENIAEELKKEDCCLKVTDLAVNGRDAAEIGFKGKEIGEALEFALNAVIDEQIENNTDEIKDLLRRYFDEKAKRR